MKRLDLFRCSIHRPPEGRIDLLNGLLAEHDPIAIDRLPDAVGTDGDHLAASQAGCAV